MGNKIVGSPLTPKLLQQMEAFTEFPDTPDFEPNGDWVNFYKVWSSKGYLIDDDNMTNGFIRIERISGAQSDDPFQLIIDKEVVDDEGITNTIHAEIECENDQLARLREWKITSSFTENKNSLIPDCDIVETAIKKGTQLEIRRGEETLITEVAEPLTADCCIFELVQRLAFQASVSVKFNLFEGLNKLKHDQSLSYRGTDTIELDNGTRLLHCFQQLGKGVLPYEYWLDKNHRLMVATTLSRAYILTSTNPVTEVEPETIFERFEEQPNWENHSTNTTIFTYNSSGWLDADIARDTVPSMYYKELSTMYDKTIEFWWEMDLQMVDSDDNLAQCLFGVFNDDDYDNHHNVIADRFFYVEHSSGSRGNRHDVYGWDSEGNENKEKGAPYEPGIPYGKSVRVKGHYWYENIMDVGKAILSVYEINSDGSTGDLIMTTGASIVVEAGQSLSFNVFGLGNRTDGSQRDQNHIKVDNLYFSNQGENPDPILPSFGV